MRIETLNKLSVDLIDKNGEVVNKHTYHSTISTH